MTGRPPPNSLSRPASRGFTLTELAVALVIVTIMIGGLLLPFATQDELRRTQETQKTLGKIREALLGYVVAQGRLPCPATAASLGQEAPAGGGACTVAYAGFVPAVTLGIGPVNGQQLAIDAWGRPIRYAVTTATTNAFTTIDGIRSNALGSLVPDLRVCASSTPVSGSKCASPETSNALITDAAAVVFSTGRNGGDAGGADETLNQGADRVFIFHEPTPATAANGEFDDLMIWLSPNILYNRMIAAERLP